MTKTRVEIPTGKIQPPPAGSIGIRAYARHRTANGKPISHTGIRKAVDTGRIAGAVWRDEKGRAWIDPTAADALFERNTDPAAQREAPAGGRPPVPEVETLFAPGGPKPEVVSTSAAAESDRVRSDFNEARASREKSDAEMARLKLEKELGRLVDAGVVRARSEAAATLVRDALLQIPVRIAGQLAAETDMRRVRELLTHEIRTALEALADYGLRAER